MQGVAALPAFLATLRRFYAAEAAADPEAAAILEPVLRALSPVEAASHRPARRLLPACALLPEALAAARRGPLAELAAAFEALEPALQWIQNPNYSDERMGAGYMAGYAYANIVGPTGLLQLSGLLTGLLILGPGRTYPDHAHPAAEVYHVVAGTAEWRREDGAWEPRAPGSRVVHRPWVRHATRTGRETLLAYYCWQGETETYADLVPGPET